MKEIDTQHTCFNRSGPIAVRPLRLVSHTVYGGRCMPSTPLPYFTDLTCRRYETR